MNPNQLASDIKQWGTEIGFQQIGITNVDLAKYEARFIEWLQQGFHGEMAYMAKHGAKRSKPSDLIPNTISIIAARMDYLPIDVQSVAVLRNKKKAYIARYALGRDYHKLIRKRLQTLAQKIALRIGKFGYRVFCDSAPVLEKPIAEKAGLGWIGKHTNLIHPKAGSWFFLGEIYTDLDLPNDTPVNKSHCGSCQACIQVCPTNAIVAPYQLDARKCISYLTIELRESIPVALRPLIGNRIYGCDDCQLFCPWNKFAKYSLEQDFHPRHQLHTAELLDLFNWSENDFDFKTQSSPIRRIGYECWLRNLAIALGNAPYDENILQALFAKLNHPSALVREHVAWALARQTSQRMLYK